MSGKPKSDKADEIKLVPIAAFKRAFQKVLSNTKRESDRQLANLQAANTKKRAAKKKR